MKPAVFFDRDGVLNIDSGYTYRIEDFVWLPGAQETVKLFNDQGYYIFVVTNQSGIARNYYAEQDVDRLHAWMNSELARIGAHIDAFYYCPHYPEAANEKYRRICDCRKPAPGLILRALQEWPADREKSFLIGDKESDLEAARQAGINGYLFTGGNLLEFVDTFLWR